MAIHKEYDSICDTDNLGYLKHYGNDDCSYFDKQSSETVWSAMQVVEVVAAMLLARKEEQITDELAYERARNIATSLIGITIK